MLQFFRKYQRYFFVFITVVIVLSFSFFGTFSAFAPSDQHPDRVLVKGAGGVPIKEREVEMIKRFLTTQKEDSSLWQSGLSPNLLCDSLVYQDFLKTGMGAMLAQQYLEEIKPDLQSRLSKIKHFKPYTHPHAPFLSAQMIWQQFAPAIAKELGLLKEKSEAPSSEVFDLLCKLYVAQASFPSELLKRILLNAEQQYEWIQKDQGLPRENLTLFGFQTTEDWFGPRFLEMIAQFIINSAQIAEREGLFVSDQEARAELLQQAFLGLKIFFKSKTPTLADAQKFMQDQLRSMGLSESDGFKIWRKILMFRRLFNHQGDAIAADSLTAKEFAKYAEDCAKVDHYSLPQELCFNDFQSLLKLQFYIEAVCANPLKLRNHPLHLPKAYLPVEVVEKSFPELVQKRFFVEYASVQKEEVALKVSVKETWDWELEEDHWVLLKEKFPDLAAFNPTSREERFFIFERLDPVSRQQIDHFARFQIVDAHPEWVDEILQQLPRKTDEMSFRMRGESKLLAGLKDAACLLSLLDAAPIKALESNLGIQSHGKLSRFSEDQKTFYHIVVLAKASSKEILSFAESFRDGTLDSLLDRRLAEAYPEVRKKDPLVFRAEGNSWKPLEEVKDQVGARLYADLLKAIDAPVGQAEHSSLDEYASLRLLEHVDEAKKHLEINPQDVDWIQPLASDPEPTIGWLPLKPLEKQWNLIKKTEEIKRSHKSQIKDFVFSLPQGAFSKVQTSSNGEISFFHLLQRETHEGAYEAQLQQEKENLAIDAKRHLMHRILDEIREKQAIKLSSFSKEEVE